MTSFFEDARKLLGPNGRGEFSHKAAAFGHSSHLPAPTPFSSMQPEFSMPIGSKLARRATRLSQPIHFKN